MTTINTDIKIVWVEKAQKLSHQSLEFLRPTIKKVGSEIWFSWNPRNEINKNHV